jgi:hypothetical protein
LNASSFKPYAYRSVLRAYNSFGKPAKRILPVSLLVASVQDRAERVQSLVVRVQSLLSGVPEKFYPYRFGLNACNGTLHPYNSDRHA